MQIPVYLILGFLDSGKSQFINGVLSDGLAADHRTLLLQCEEGEVEYDPRLMKNVSVAAVEDEELAANMVQVLYVHAMLAGHYTLGEKETEVLNTGLIRLMEYGLGGNL